MIPGDATSMMNIAEMGATKVSESGAPDSECRIYKLKRTWRSNYGEAERQEERKGQGKDQG